MRPQLLHLTNSKGAFGLFPSAVIKSGTYWSPKDNTVSNLVELHTLQALIAVTLGSVMSAREALSCLVFLLFGVKNSNGEASGVITQTSLPFQNNQMSASVGMVCAAKLRWQWGASLAGVPETKDKEALATHPKLLRLPRSGISLCVYLHDLAEARLSC